MSDSHTPYDDEAFRRERVEVSKYDRGIRDAGGDGAAEAREEHRGRLSYDDNDATAPGKVCELCRSVIVAGQQARLRPDGWWVHEACPIR